MEKYYRESLEKLIEYMKNNEVNPSEIRWNSYAVKYNFLSAESIGYIYGNGFKNLCRKIRKELNSKRIN